MPVNMIVSRAIQTISVIIKLIIKKIS